MLLTEDERTELDRRTAIAMSTLDGKENVRDALIDIYCGYLPGKERWQGEMMADKVIASVFWVKDQYAMANESAGGYIDSKLEEAVRGMDTETACKSLSILTETLKILDSGTVKALFSSSEPERALVELRNQVQEREYPGPYDLVSRNRLMREARCLLSGSAVTGLVLEEVERSAEYAGNAARRILTGRIQEEVLVAVNAMVLYTMAAGNGIGSLNYPATIDEVVLAVYSREYMEQALLDYRDGIMTLYQYRQLAASVSSVAVLLLWGLEVCGSLAAIIFALDHIGPLTALAVAYFMLTAFSEITELMVDDIEKVVSALSMDLYRKSLKRQLRRNAVDVSAAEKQIHQETGPVTLANCPSEETGLEEIYDEGEEIAEIEL